MIENKTEIRVRYADTDQMHFVYNGKYLEYFEVGRTELLREIGLPYEAIEKEGFLLPVLEAYVKYKLPAYYDDVLVVKSFLKKNPDLKVHIDYEILRKNSTDLIAEGFTIHAFIDKRNKKVTRPPDFFVKAIKKFFPEVL
ncbi:MAG: thioesterase [Ignavibacteria bacterium GWA2_35_9]|nr:MAG: thioesterase [Ignavibacteria bacterium GWA2_35_9]OGU46436.1 MAG: thioesterase [Ignavibacteria bacterium GWB2_36_8]OGU50458.1 MAG: thioesterase [Ignavibacteria bacterium GWC2_36_12]